MEKEYDKLKTKYDLTSLKNGFDELKISITEKQICQLLLFYEKMIEKNRVMNLTSITNFEEAVQKHFLDSLSLVYIVDLNREKTLLDLGTGAGFPGIPLKIAFPHLQITLADSLNKRVKFLNEVIDVLELEGIEAVHGRAEDLGRLRQYREQFDLCVSRAVANLSVLSEYCLPFIKVGGVFVSYKSAEIGEELHSAERAIRLLGGETEKTEHFSLPGGEMKRTLVKIKKVKKTPASYPRRAGAPAKNPL